MTEKKTQKHKTTIQKLTKIKKIPSNYQFKKWVNLVLATQKKEMELLVRITGPKEITKLNKLYRNKNKPTNVLSFPFEPIPGIKEQSNFLGEVIICAQIVKQEAKIANKTTTSHFAHLTIHGVLHLIGFDHQNSTQANKMEKLEIKYMKLLGFNNPYGKT